jgi:phosphatidylinositol alpha-mannosyltransferase
VTSEALRRYYHTADIFCAPATGRESFGIVLCEAMAAGQPIVASNIDGFAGVVTDSAEGLLVPPGNEEALAQALERLIRDPNLRHRMGQQGKVSVQKYRWDRVAGRVVECYEEAMALGGR